MTKTTREGLVFASKKGKLNYVTHSESSKGYRYIEKDDMMYLVLSLVDDSGQTDNDTAFDAGISKSTLYNWRFGKTQRPQHVTLKAVLQAIGYDTGVYKS